MASHTHPYTHGVYVLRLAGRNEATWGLGPQDASDHEAAAAEILGALGRGRRVRGIGLGSTASSPLPTTADGTPLSRLHSGVPHAYAKLWKHAAAQAQADRINSRGGDHLADVGGRLSANSLLAKSAEMAEEAPVLWEEAERFIEAGAGFPGDLPAAKRAVPHSPPTRRIRGRTSAIRPMPYRDWAPSSARSIPSARRRAR